MIPAEALRVNRNLADCHVLVRMRWPAIKAQLEQLYGIQMFVNETYRSDVRQQYLYGAGRSVAECQAKGIPAEFARPSESRVTNAWSATTSAHGWMEDGKPAAAALDVVPLGLDGRPWTADDPWDAFVATVAKIGPLAGLVHFHAPGKAVWDKPHLELVEWNNRLHRLILTEAA